MKLSDHLDSNTKSKLNKLKDTKKPKNNKKTPQANADELSTRDWEEVMGIHRDRFERVRGKIRRK